jgi:tetratricopeptide (TPR) repeat protein
MSLLLEALKKAEKAKEDAQRRAQESDGAGELRLADDATASADARRVTTRDELPQITSPLEIHSEDIAPSPADAQPGGLSLQDASRPTPGSGPASGAQAQGASRATARKVFEAKVREPNPRLPFFIAIGALGAFAIGTVIYFWIQLRPPASIYNASPPPPANEIPVAPAPSVPNPAAGGTGGTTAGTIPGLPQAAPPARESRPAPQRRASPAVAARTPAPAESPRAAPRPAPKSAARLATPSQRAPAAAGTLATNRPPLRVNPSVAAGYSAYQAGDMNRARSDYEQALREEPGNRDALLGLAAVETRARHPGAADALYRRLLLDDPRDPYAAAGLLALHAQQIDPVAAESRVKGLLASGPDEDVLHFTLGNQYAQQGRWAEARQAYARAAAMDPENPDYAYNLAVSLEHLRQPQPAQQAYRRALTLALQRTASFDPAMVQGRIEQLSH